MAKLKSPVFHLTWPEGSEMSDDEVEIWVGSLTVGEYNEGLRLGAMANKTNKVSEELVESDARVSELFADRLRRWNLEDDKGKPLPTDLKTVRSLPNRTMNIISKAWFEAMTEVPTNSSDGSNGTKQSAEESLMMGASSQPQTSG